jgi:alkylated DNA repair dioxygenase AlkB
MSVSVQESLLDMGDELAGPVLGELGGSVRRTPLAHGGWVDFCPGWLMGSAEVFGALVETVPWRAEQRKMYDRVVAVPRLLCFYGEDAPLPDPVLTAAREALNAHYGPELGEPFRTAGLCLYRDGRDSVAWHGDTIERGQREDTMVAIVSLGTPRPLLLRPRGGSAGSGARPLRFEVGHGDLLVMGGSCQRTWEHAVPKTSRAVGPRISVQFRPRGVR